jgi:lambda family phage portal protein
MMPPPRAGANAGPRLLGPDGAPIASRPRLGDRMDGVFGQGGRYFDNAYDGASFTSPDLAGWTPFNIAPQAALSLDRARLAARVHDTARNDGWAAASVSRQVDNIIGEGWRLTAKPNAVALGISPEEANELALNIESEWRDYTTDSECFGDAGRRQTLGGQMATAFRHRAADGEALGAILWLDRGGDYCTALQVIDPDRLSNPFQGPDLYWRRQGIELGPNDEPVAYNIRAAHPGDIGVVNPKWFRWERVMRQLPNGRRQIIHAFEPNSAGMVRGVSPLAPVLQKLHMLGRYDKAELQAALINAMLAATVTSPGDQEQIAEALSGGEGVSGFQDARIGFYDGRPLKMDGAQVNYLYPTDKLELTRPNHPNSGFDAFYRTGLRNIAAAAGLSYEQLTMDWSQTNYSSARGALLEVWKGFNARKGNWAHQFVGPFYGAWLEEAIARGKVKLPKGAPAFREKRQAYCACRWIGPPRGWVDPLKETQASVLRISSGLSTFEEECGAQGQWYVDVFHQRARERAEMKALGLDPDELLRSNLPKGTRPGVADPPPEPAGETPAGEKDENEDDGETGAEANSQ